MIYVTFDPSYSVSRNPGTAGNLVALPRLPLSLDHFAVPCVACCIMCVAECTLAGFDGSNAMPRKETIRKAKQDKRAGKSPSTQAGEFVREEMDKIRHGEHGARSPQQAIAIGLSEARRAGVDLPPPRKGKAKARTRRSAKYAYDAGQGRRKTRRRPRVSRAVKQVLKREPRSSASRGALSKQAKRAASHRSAASRSAAARKAVRTKGAKGRSVAAKKAARTRTRVGRPA
jgi:Family of unknown function (DUF6496)